ncbi:prolyl oligopeptidase family serine peptidase [Kitasatospora sp. NPDC089797]|uniref:prolyl oligopeptidase family serine peptidase n=1 Tax=Kitasatospora sp. NPDC089797 TaxID=3155298 RepID=UPI003438B24E
MTTDSLPRQLARARHFTLGAPVRPEPSADGTTVLFLRSRGGADPVGCLWALDTGSGAEQLVADGGITSYSTDGAGVLAAFARDGGVWLADTRTGSVRRVVSGGSPEDVRLDPTGRRIAYISGGALRVVEADGTDDRALAEPEAEDVTYGLAEYVAVGEMERDRGCWWSPDGTALLVARVDNRRVTRWFLADPADPAQPPRAVRYPLAGTANAEVSLWLLGLDGGRTEVRWDRAAFEYLTAAGWDGHGPYAAVQSRDQRTVRTLAVAADGATRVLAERTDARWVELVPGLPVRTAGGALVDTADSADSDRSGGDGGTRRLTVDGQPVTPAGLQLRAVLGTDGETVLFTASEEPTETHLWTYEPGTGTRRLSSGPGLHDGVRRGGTLVLTTRSPDGGTVVLRDGRAPLPLVSYAEPPVVTARPELLRLGPRDLRAHLFLPAGHGPGAGPLPVLVDPYGGPAMQKVTRSGAWHEQVSQWFADQGFAVLVVDGRGTPGRGPRWDKSIWGDKAGPALEDQIEALHETARLRPGLLDLDRVGIRGWSYGGFLAALAVLRRPDVFHAASAGAAPTDHRLYDTHWQERFLGHPDRYPEHYDSCDLIAEASKLSRPLLLIQGMADDNVFPVHALRFSSALLAAGRPHELLPLRGAGHRLTEEAMVENLLRHELDFLRRSLGMG